MKLVYFLTRYIRSYIGIIVSLKRNCETAILRICPTFYIVILYLYHDVTITES